MRKDKVVVAFVLLLAAAAVLYARHAANRALTADEAVSKGYVAVSVAYGRAPLVDPETLPAGVITRDPVVQSASTGDSERDGPNVVTVTFTRMDAAPDREITVTLPVGSLVRNGAPGSQRLITTATVTVRLTPGARPVAVSVPTYCLDAFLLEPAADSPLSLATTALVDKGENLTPVRKLVECLSGGGQAFEARQQALWLVGEGLFDTPYAQAREFLSAHWREAMVEETNAKIENDKRVFRDAIHRQHPDITDTDADEALALITADHLTTQIETRAKAFADRDAEAFRSAKPVLAGCGYKVDKLAFFQS